MARDSYDQAYTADYFDQYDSTISNGEARIPICFCIDTSGSMNNLMNRDEDMEKIEGTERIEDGKKVYSVRLRPGVEEITSMTELRRVLKRMIQRMQRNALIKNSAVVCIVTFDQFADCMKEFSNVDHISNYEIDKICSHENMTNTGRGINMCLDRLDRFRAMNNQAGNESYRPVLILMTDGTPTDGDASEKAGETIRRRSDEGKLNVIPIAIGDAPDKKYLRRLSSDNKVYSMRTEDEFDEVFRLLTQRITRTAEVISVDEGMTRITDMSDPYSGGNSRGTGRNGSGYESSEPAGADPTSTQYGADTSTEDLLNFLESFVNS